MKRDLTKAEVDAALADAQAQAENPPDTDTIDGIKAEYLFLANNPLVGYKGLTPAWGTAAVAMVDHLLALSDDALTGPVDWISLKRTAEAAVPELQQLDLLHATLHLGGWAGLLDMTHVYLDPEAGEVPVKHQAVFDALGGEPRHPLTGAPDPEFENRTVVRYHATEKLRRLRRLHAKARATSR